MFINLKLSHKSLKRSFNLDIEVLCKRIFHAQGVQHLQQCSALM